MCRSYITVAMASLLTVVCIFQVPAQEGGRGGSAARQGERLRYMQEQIDNLQSELQDLRGRERGVLGELERLGVELRLRRAEQTEAEIRLAEVREEIKDRTARLETLERSQEERRRYLTFRLREMYKQGPVLGLRRVLGGDDLDSMLSGFRYAAFLSGRDARVIERFREEISTIEAERDGLQSERANLDMVRRDAIATSRALARSKKARAGVLADVRKDQSLRLQALGELESASRELAGLIDTLGSGDVEILVDIRKFRGLLQMPVDGRISARFGKVVHPRFKTVVPHPGLDIEAGQGKPIHAIFDGRVVYSGWLRGYGLTVIIDHGSGMMSIYAHASVLLAGEEDDVVSGQKIGLVGETGSLKGPFLYFELRRDGDPIDPEPWFK